MARRHRHHRKIRQNRTAAPTPQLEAIRGENLSSESAPLTVQSSLSEAVRLDLRLTLMTIVGLIAALLVITYLNDRYGWSLQFGNQLYQLLHIR